MSDPLQITLRLIHIFAGVFGAGTAFFLLCFLMPALAGSGAGGQAVMQHLATKQKLGVVVPTAGLLTVLSGLGMYARNVAASSGVRAHSRQGITPGRGDRRLSSLFDLLAHFSQISCAAA